MDFSSDYEIARTAEYIRAGSFSRVALQFPDELLKDSARVARALREQLGKGVKLYVLADTVYGSCCVDEVAASHVDAECVVHYGHACMSPTSTLAALFIFGKSSLNINACSESLHCCLSVNKKPVLVLFGLEYAYAIPTIKSKMATILPLTASDPVLHFSDVTCSSMNPVVDGKTQKEQAGNHYSDDSNGGIHNHVISHRSSQYNWTNEQSSFSEYSLGGLTWSIPKDHKMEDFLLFWIGSDNSAFTNAVLTFNKCNIVRFDTKENLLVEDVSHQKKILKRRYYLVEKAKDANIVGILVGTLGVAGYLHMIQQIKELIERAGKKAYTFIMGKPNPAKVANFPECDVFVYVSCAQTALLDSKEYLAPIITPFEAMLAFDSGSQWTGEYLVEFPDTLPSEKPNAMGCTKEARFSFLSGGYVEDIGIQEDGDEKQESSIILAEGMSKALSLEPEGVNSILFKGAAKSGSEFFTARSYHGLDMSYENSSSQSFIIGRTGKASGYDDEKK